MDKQKKTTTFLRGKHHQKNFGQEKFLKQNTQHRAKRSKFYLANLIKSPNKNFIVIELHSGNDFP